jgi:hypothetical protein
MSDLKIKITLFFAALIVAIIWLLWPDKEGENRVKYLDSVNLNISGIVKQVMPLRDEYRSCGTIYLQNIKSNKSAEFESAYKGRCTIFKISNNEAIVVTPSIELINPGDSVVYHTKPSIFKIYRKGKLFIEDNFGLIANDDFYERLNASGYLNFSHYHKK